MIVELDSGSFSKVAGGDEMTHEWGTWVGAALGEVSAHPIGAMFGVAGIVIAHYVTAH